jgi:RNA polymerase sigma-70 factor (ECF subfamily)
MLANKFQLVEAALGGELQAMTELVEEHYAPIYAFLRRLSRNEADAADLTQKTFSRLWPALARFAGRSSVSSWIHGIAYHVYQDYLRSNSHTESRTEAWWKGCPDTGTAPDAQAVAADLNAALFAAVDQLEPDLRSPVHLHYYQGLTLDETAQVLEVSPRTVKYRLRAALDQLQARITDEPKSIPQNVLTKRL